MKCTRIVMGLTNDRVLSFEEGSDKKDLHLLYRDGMACVNYIDNEGQRVNRDYPIYMITHCHHEGNKFHSVKH